MLFNLIIIIKHYDITNLNIVFRKFSRIKISGLSTTSIKLTDDITKAIKHKEAPIIDNDVTVSPDEIFDKEKLSGLISIPVEV